MSKSKERLNDNGGLLLRTIQFRFSRNVPLIFPAVVSLTASYLIAPQNKEHIWGEAMSFLKNLSLAFFIIFIFLVTFIIFKFILTKIRVYENAVQIKGIFQNKIIFPYDIEYIRIAESKAKFNVDSGNVRKYLVKIPEVNKSIFIKPYGEKEIKLLYNEYGDALDIFTDWKISNEIPDYKE